MVLVFEEEVAKLLFRYAAVIAYLRGKDFTPDMRRIIRASQGAEKLYGFGPNGLNNLPIRELVPESQWAAQEERQRLLDVDERPHWFGGQHGFTAKHKNGSEFAADFRLIPCYTEDGVPLTIAEVIETNGRPQPVVKG